MSHGFVGLPHLSVRHATSVAFACAFVASVAILPVSGAAFSGADSNAANTITAASVVPPTSVSVVGSALVTISWTPSASPAVSGHRVYRATSSGGPYVRVADVSATSTTSTVDGAVPGTYYYILRAYLFSWESVDSSEVSITISSGQSDFDGYFLSPDNCPSHFNIEQLDTDGDGLGDVCDGSSTAVSGASFATKVTLGNEQARGVVAVDVDYDGDLDLMFSNFAGVDTIWLNSGSASFTDSGQSLGNNDDQLSGFGDLDGDGYVDLMVPSTDGSSHYFVNNGSGSFSESGQSLMNNAASVDLADYDNDGDLDVLMTAISSQPTIYKNNGSGSFSSITFTGYWDVQVAAFGDFDLDGLIDVVLGRSSGATTIWRQSPAGTFTDTGHAFTGDDTNAIEVVDLDDDGDLDLIVSNLNINTTVWLNNGTGSFSSTSQTVFGSGVTSMAVGDIDGDGDQDLVLGKLNSPVQWLLNNGSGIFSDSGLNYGNESIYGLALIDLDGDGDLDLALADATSASNSVRLNQ